MRKSIIQGLSEKDMKAVIDTYDLNDFYWPNLFPLKFTPTLTWKELTTKFAVPVAADVVSFNARSPRKTRRVVSRNQGEIPKIDIAYDKEESDINEYNSLLHYAGSESGNNALLDWIYDDSESCWKGVNARIEWLALRAMSTGRIVLNSKNNGDGIVTEEAVSFGIPETHKMGVSVTFRDNAPTAKPIDLFKKVVKAAKKEGVKITDAFMNPETFDDIVATAQVQKFCANWMVKVTGMESAPNLEALNSALEKERLPKIHIIDSLVTIQVEGKDTVCDPWEDGVICFAPSLVQGNTYHAPLADESIKDSPAVKYKREHVLIKKFSEEDPVVETTKGMANAFPAWGNASKCFLVDTKSGSWNKTEETDPTA